MGRSTKPGEGVEESLLARIQELRAENEQLREAFENSEAACLIQIQMARTEDDVHRRLAEERAQEIEQLHTRLAESEAENDQWQKKLADTWAEVERLRAALDTHHEGLLPNTCRVCGLDALATAPVRG